ncbi:MAG: Maf family protein [Thermoanaerobaculia bacterium]|nr:Maf family protein [Thermoanaerobaculia bacterium]
MTSPRLVLASASPRRRRLLETMEVDFTVRPTNLPEARREGESARGFVERMAREKAMAGVGEEDELLLGSDTVVVLGGRVLGKPSGPADAEEMLRRLSGRTHEVLTGVALHRSSTGRTLSRVASTDVIFRDLEEEEIEWYVSTGEPLDKAGGYGIQGRAAIFIPGIRGSYSNVVGLPLETVDRLLREMGSGWRELTPRI